MTSERHDGPQSPIFGIQEAKIKYWTHHNPNITKIGWLQSLRNKHGPFKVAKAHLGIEGDPVWTRHHDVLDLWQTDKGILFLGYCNNRTCFPSEIIFDLDDKPTISKAKKISTALSNTYHIPHKVYASGGKGFHIHANIYELALQPKQTRVNLRRYLLKKYECDTLKASEASMIALENTPHWRTNKPKHELWRWPP